ncbi:hypothetical protein PR202_ga11277 [Eleusine coracana subsp. coracana]|uniref:Uncharacterized protein n=1 Tax=Eleusine coracana subsp. coracana TaxID=191504 RepID=A0AAV5C909_ELECO|nr:hypothetical protein QOZ80_5AG0404750 [Eleusine coracana subsp. coracana]GJM94615.1 hypothetical protein PR202_ga11277 [Eleusine coracana subsp. coracana]
MEERKEVAGPSSKEKEEKKYEKKEEKKDEKKEEKKKVESTFPYPYNKPVSRSSSTTIEKFSASLQRSATASFNRSPVAVAIGPYYHGSPQLQEMEDVKRAALKEFLIRRSSAREKCEAVHGKVLSLVGSTRRCYAGGEKEFRYMEDGEWAEMLFRDAWFVLQFMVSMFPDRDALPELDLLMSRAEVHTRISDIMRDLLLLENQVPWTVIEALMELWPFVPLDSFLRLMAFPFHIGNEDINNNEWRNPAVTHDDELLDRRTTSSTQGGHHHQLPSHLLGLFYRRQVGTACTQELLVPKLSSLSSTAVELTEMGVKLTASKTKRFGDMTMSKRRCRGLGLSGELSLTPLVLNNLTACWLVNMAAYEECLGATQADNYASAPTSPSSRCS